MKILLGVIDIPYSDASYAPKPKRQRLGAARRGQASTSAPAVNSKTTGEVAEILEAKYNIMEIFFDAHKYTIVQALEQSAEDAMQALVFGKNDLSSISAEAESHIEATFRNWLVQKGMDGLANGVPTKASLDGVSHRFLHPYAKRPSRPSFIDTGLYVANMKMWTED